jgi:hypothetical protein
MSTLLHRTSPAQGRHASPAAVIRRKAERKVRRRFPDDTPRQFAQHVEIELSDMAKRRKRAHDNAWTALERLFDLPKGHPRIGTLRRLAELEVLFSERYKGELPEDDAGLDDLAIAFNHIAYLDGEVIEHMTAWAAKWAPWLRGRQCRELAERIAAAPRKYTARVLGDLLRLTDEERFRLGIRTIRSIDPAETPKDRKRRLDRERIRALRAKAKAETGPKPPKPPAEWEVLGISRATFYRRRKAAAEAAKATWNRLNGETEIASRVGSLYLRHGFVSLRQAAAAGSSILPASCSRLDLEVAAEGKIFLEAPPSPTTNTTLADRKEPDTAREDRAQAEPEWQADHGDGDDEVETFEGCTPRPDERRQARMMIADAGKAWIGV